MKKTVTIILLVLINIINAQEKFTLNLKFNEKYFLANFLKFKINNKLEFSLIKKADSISKLKVSYNYAEILDSLAIKDIYLETEKSNSFSMSEKKEFDSLFNLVKKGKLLEKHKKLIQNIFGSEMLDKQLKKLSFKNYNITQLDYNRILLSFSDKIDYEKVRDLLNNHKLLFHESIDNKDLEIIQNCVLNENKTLVNQNNLKRENDYLLISNRSRIKTNSKCFNSTDVSVLLKKDMVSKYSKLFFVKNTGELENSISKSIKGFVLQLKKNEKSSNEDYYFYTFYLDDNGKNSLKTFTTKNTNKIVFISNESQIINNSKMETTFGDGIFYIKDSNLDKNWQETYDFIRFEVFKNSITIQ